MLLMGWESVSPDTEQTQIIKTGWTNVIFHEGMIKWPTIPDVLNSFVVNQGAQFNSILDIPTKIFTRFHQKVTAK